MRCLICNSKLDRIIKDEQYRGGFRPCSKCQHYAYDDALLLYDESDPSDDIQTVVDNHYEKGENTWSE